MRAEDRDIPAADAERIPRWLVLLVPVGAAIVASPGLGAQLLCDDFALLHQNRFDALSDLLATFLAPSSLVSRGEPYRPLTDASIGLDHLIWGLNPFGYHLINLLLHAVNSMLCYALVRALVPPRPVVALTAALLFAAHPVHADAIFWVAARADLLCTLFFLSSLILFVRGTGPRRRRCPTVGSVLLFGMALLSKPAALSLPVMVVILDLAAPAPERLVRRLVAHLPRYLVYLAVALGYLTLRWLVLPPAARDLAVGGTGALFNLALYIKLLLMPLQTHTGLRGGVVLVLAVFVLWVTFLRYARMGDRRNMALGLIWMVVTLAPSLDLVRRWQLYLPSVGLCVFFAIVLAGLTWRRDPDHPLWLARIGGLVLLSLLIAGGVMLGYHATVYRHAGDLAQSIISQIRELEPHPPPGRTLHVANLPAELTSRTGDQPLFAFGFPEALQLHYGRDDLGVQVLSTLYVRQGQAASPSIRRHPDGSLTLSAGGGAYAFSFHGPDLTTGRDRPFRGQVVTRGSWTSRIDAVEQGQVKRLHLRYTGRGGSPSSVLAWDGQRIGRVAAIP